MYRQIEIFMQTGVALMGMGILIGVALLIRQGCAAQHEVAVMQQWCSATCGAQRVLVCETVQDPAWPEARWGVGCLLDGEGREVRFVVKEPER